MYGDAVYGDAVYGDAVYGDAVYGDNWWSIGAEKLSNSHFCIRIDTEGSTLTKIHHTCKVTQTFRNWDTVQAGAWFIKFAIILNDLLGYHLNLAHDHLRDCLMASKWPQRPHLY